MTWEEEGKLKIVTDDDKGGRGVVKNLIFAVTSFLNGPYGDIGLGNF